MAQQPFMNFISVLILIGVVQGLFLACALVFMRRGNRRANILLAMLLLSVSVLLLDGFLNANYYSRYPRLLCMTWPANFLIGPFLYFYVRELSLPRRTVVSWTQLLHFVPVTASTLIICYSLIAYGNAPGWAAWPTLMGAQIHAKDVALFLVAIQKFVYFILSFLLVLAYGTRVKESFSSLEKISLSWLRTLLLSFFGLFFLFLFSLFFAAYLGIQREIIYLLYLGLAVISSLIAFKGLLQPEIFSQIEAANQVERIRTDHAMVPDALPLIPDMPQDGGAKSEKGKYRKSLLTEERKAELVCQLQLLMETEKPFLDPELTLPELADRLSVSSHNLSQVINQEMNKSFFDFVNEYRVQEAKKLLSSPQHGHFSILAIALDAGFNSKSAFYTAFGKNTGTIPSQYRKQQVWSEQGSAPNISGNA